MFIAFCDSQLLALRRSAMCLSRKRLHLAPDGATSLTVICGYKQIAPPKHRLQELLLTLCAKPFRQMRLSTQKSSIGLREGSELMTGTARSCAPACRQRRLSAWL